MPTLTLFSNGLFHTHSLFLLFFLIMDILFSYYLFYWLGTTTPETRTVQFLHKHMYAWPHSVL